MDNPDKNKNNDDQEELESALERLHMDDENDDDDDDDYDEEADDGLAEDEIVDKAFESFLGRLNHLLKPPSEKQQKIKSVLSYMTSMNWGLHGDDVQYCFDAKLSPLMNHALKNFLNTHQILYHSYKEHDLTNFIVLVADISDDARMLRLDLEQLNAYRKQFQDSYQDIYKPHELAAIDALVIKLLPIRYFMSHLALQTEECVLWLAQLRDPIFRTAFDAYFQRVSRIPDQSLREYNPHPLTPGHGESQVPGISVCDDFADALHSADKNPAHLTACLKRNPYLFKGLHQDIAIFERAAPDFAKFWLKHSTFEQGFQSIVNTKMKFD